MFCYLSMLCSKQLMSLFQYLHSLLQLKATSNDTTDSGTQQQRFEHVAMALEALRNVMKSSPGNELYFKGNVDHIYFPCIQFKIVIIYLDFIVLGVEEKCIGQFKLIFSLLRMSEATKLQQLALEVSNWMRDLLSYSAFCKLGGFFKSVSFHDCL